MWRLAYPQPRDDQPVLSLPRATLSGAGRRADQADQARPEPPQRSHSVTKLAATGQLLMAASGQVPTTANNPASIKPRYLQDAPRGHTVYLLVYRQPPSRPRILTDEAASVG